MDPQAYMRKYGAQGDGQPNLGLATEEFDDWVLRVPFKEGYVRILCCPEDRQCPRPGCTESETCCPECVMPLCRECKDLDRSFGAPWVGQRHGRGGG